jgi:hypothetical protein
MSADADYAAIRVVYRPVTDDLPDNAKRLGDEQHETLTEWEWERNSDGDIVRVRGQTAAGRDVIAPVPEYHKSSVRARDAGDEGTFNLNLGWVQRLEGVQEGE